MIDLNAANAALWSADYGGARDLYWKCLAFARENNAQAHTLVSAIGLTLADIYTGRFAEANATIASVAVTRGQHINEEANRHLCRALIAAPKAAMRAPRWFPTMWLCRSIVKGLLGLLYAITLALATLTALDAADDLRCHALGEELNRVPEEFLDGEEFPHLMLWAKSRMCALLGDSDEATVLLNASSRLYDARARAIGQRISGICRRALECSLSHRTVGLT